MSKYKGLILKEKDTKNTSLFTDLFKKDQDLKNNINEVLTHNGFLYGIEKDNKLKSIYLFETIKHSEHKMLRLIKEVHLDEVTDEIKKEFIEIISNDLKKKLNFKEYKKVSLKDIDIIPHRVVITKLNIIIGIILLMIGIGFTVITKQFFYLIVSILLILIEFLVIIKKE